MKVARDMVDLTSNCSQVIEKFEKNEIFLKTFVLERTNQDINIKLIN